MDRLEASYVDVATKEPLTEMRFDDEYAIAITVNGELLTYLAAEYEFVVDELTMMWLMKSDDSKYEISFVNRVMDKREGVLDGYDETYYSVPHRLMFVDGEFVTAKSEFMWLFVKALSLLKNGYVFTSKSM